MPFVLAGDYCEAFLLDLSIVSFLGDKTMRRSRRKTHWLVVLQKSVDLKRYRRRRVIVLSAGQ